MGLVNEEISARARDQDAAGNDVPARVENGDLNGPAHDQSRLVMHGSPVSRML